MRNPITKTTDHKTTSDYTDLTELIYAATLDSHNYDEMEIAWNKIFDTFSETRDPAAFQSVAEKVSQHAQRALEISQSLEKSKNDPQSPLDEFSLPCFAVDRSGKIFDHNNHAKPYDNQTYWSDINDIGFKSGALDDIRQFFKSTENNSLSVTENGEMFFLDVMPDRLAQRYSSQTSQLFILRVSALDWNQQFAQELLDQFQITNAESEILEHLVQGTHLNDIAQIRGTTVRTTRTQLKTLQAKLHQPSQAKLIRWAMIMLLVHKDNQRVDSPIAEVAPPLKNPKFIDDWDPGTRRTITLPNGADVDLFTFGNPNGEIMLQLHALMYAPPPTDELFPQAREFGHYSIQPLRPGYGRSSPLPEGADLLTQIVTNYRLILDYLDVSTCNLLIFGTTGSIGYRVASDLSDRIKSIVSVSTSPPMKDASSIDILPSYAKFTMSAAKHAPRLFEFLVTTARRREANFNGWDAYFSRMIENIETDKITYQRPEVKQSLFEGQRLVSKQSAKAYRQELATFMDNWLPIAQSCRQPKLIVQGTDDNTWAKQSFNRFAKEIDAEMVWLEGGAYLMIYSHTKQVIETIDKWMASNKVAQ